MRAVVIGAGFGGLGAARELRRHGVEVIVLERAGAVGGVWRENTYPGAACDVPSPLYSWSWAVNPAWSHRYSPQPEILAYLEDAAREAGLLDLVRTGETVTHLRYDEPRAVWEVHTATGATYEAEVVVSAVGQLSEPFVPDLPGVQTFAGPAFHSAQWRHDVPLEGKRVAVVGTGASAIQFVPGIVDRVGSMTVFQRTPTFVVKRPDKEYSPRHHRGFARFPALLAFERQFTFHFTELYNRALTGSRALRPMLALLWLVWWQHLRRAVPDRALRRRLTPRDPLGCKRLLFSGDWYPALARDHVEVVARPVAGVEPSGVRTDDGRLHEVDVILWGTGFATTDFLRGLEVTGRGGRTLREEWEDGAAAYLGLAVPGFPNLFCVYGPGTNLGGSSIIAMMEAQARWIGSVVRGLGDRGVRAAEVRRSAHDRYDADLQERLARTVWSRCDSWYVDGRGRISTNWPGRVAEYQALLSEVAWEDLELTG